jgi:hypothetical protein
MELAECRNIGHKNEEVRTKLAEASAAMKDLGLALFWRRTLEFSEVFSLLGMARNKVYLASSLDNNGPLGKKLQMILRSIAAIERILYIRGKQAESPNDVLKEIKPSNSFNTGMSFRVGIKRVFVFIIYTLCV